MRDIWFWHQEFLGTLCCMVILISKLMSATCSNSGILGVTSVYLPPWYQLIFLNSFIQDRKTAHKSWSCRQFLWVFFFLLHSCYLPDPALFSISFHFPQFSCFLQTFRFVLTLETSEIYPEIWFELPQRPYMKPKLQVNRMEGQETFVFIFRIRKMSILLV